MLTQEEITSLDEILSSHDYDSSSVIAVMQDIQKKYRYLPEDALTYIAGKLKLSEAKIYGVATFYENFSLEPKADMSSRYVTAPPAMSVNQSPFWKNSGISWACPKPSIIRMTCFLPWKPSPVWEPAAWRRYAPSMTRFMLP